MYVRGQQVLFVPPNERRGQVVTISSIAIVANMALVVDQNNRMWGVSMDSLHDIPPKENTMPSATITVETPTGFQAQFMLEPGYDREEVKALVEGVERFTQFLAGRGWAPVDTSTIVQQGTPPSAAELSQGPTFCGYPCSPTVDERGLPSWIIAEGRQATRHEKQGDTWYSYRDGNDVYVQVLRIPKGEKAPAVTGLQP